MKYQITVKEISKATIEVEAENYEQAMELAQAKYWDNPNAYPMDSEDTYFEFP